MDEFWGALKFILRYQKYILQLIILVIFLENLFDVKIFIKKLREPLDPIEQEDEDISLSGLMLLFTF